MLGRTLQHTFGRQTQTASLVRLSSAWLAICLNASAVCLGRIRPDVHCAPGLNRKSGDLMRCSSAEPIFIWTCASERDRSRERERKGERGREKDITIPPLEMPCRTLPT